MQFIECYSRRTAVTESCLNKESTDNASVLTVSSGQQYSFCYAVNSLTAFTSLVTVFICATSDTGFRIIFPGGLARGLLIYSSEFRSNVMSFTTRNAAHNGAKTTRENDVWSSNDVITHWMDDGRCTRFWTEKPNRPVTIIWLIY